MDITPETAYENIKTAKVKVTKDANHAVYAVMFCIGMGVGCAVGFLDAFFGDRDWRFWLFIPGVLFAVSALFFALIFPSIRRETMVALRGADGVMRLFVISFRKIRYYGPEIVFVREGRRAYKCRPVSDLDAVIRGKLFIDGWRYGNKDAIDEKNAALERYEIVKEGDNVVIVYPVAVFRERKRAYRNSVASKYPNSIVLDGYNNPKEVWHQDGVRGVQRTTTHILTRKKFTAVNVPGFFARLPKKFPRTFAELGAEPFYDGRIEYI